ncbi:hypothetical protein KIS1582_0134 [Cytobacillus firmus]|uniref:Uncharacterized protein n=1 Tax=Cytobacillus firmus TaxID=1399 RepID=A0A800NGE0_CYTFI|nr:hypothetical protein KIS1582_0134 [Cytobacillus firmus]MBG9602880.1 hypothetical protein [Cytobacillus firmus]
MKKRTRNNLFFISYHKNLFFIVFKKIKLPTSFFMVRQKRKALPFLLLFYFFHVPGKSFIYCIGDNKKDIA